MSPILFLNLKIFVKKKQSVYLSPLKVLVPHVVTWIRKNGKSNAFSKIKGRYLIVRSIILMQDDIFPLALNNKTPLRGRSKWSFLFEASVPEADIWGPYFLNYPQVSYHIFYKLNQRHLYSLVFVLIHIHYFLICTFCGLDVVLYVLVVHL